MQRIGVFVENMLSDREFCRWGVGDGGGMRMFWEDVGLENRIVGLVLLSSLLLSYGGE